MADQRPPQPSPPPRRSVAIGFMLGLLGLALLNAAVVAIRHHLLMPAGAGLIAAGLLALAASVWWLVARP